MGGLPFLQSYLANPDVKKIINTLSKTDGFTPAIAACSLRQYKVVDLLADAGADIKIPSRDGTKIVTATETEVKKEAEQSTPPSKEEGLVSSFLSRIWRPLVHPNKSDVIPDVTSIDMSASVPVTPPTLNPQIEVPQIPRQQPSELSTEAFVRGVINGTLAEPSPRVETKMSTGGSRSVVVGQRFLNKAPEFSSISGGNSDSEKKKRSSKKKSKHTLRRSKERTTESKGSFELGRITDDIHERTIETIKSLLGVDEETAKIYKSVLYYRVKEEHPEMSGYERAVEMEKLATKAVLKDIDIDAARKKREELKSASVSSSETSSEKSEKKPRKKKSELSDTSSSEVSEKKSTRKLKKSESQSETTSSPELDTNLSV
jgi:hypothetical protein